MRSCTIPSSKRRQPEKRLQKSNIFLMLFSHLLRKIKNVKSEAKNFFIFLPFYFLNEKNGFLTGDPFFLVYPAGTRSKG